MLDESNLWSIAHKIKESADKAERAAERMEAAAQRMAVMLEDGYGGNALKLIELLERAEQPKFIDNIPMILRVDAAMVEMRTIHPPLRRSECERLIKAALQLSEVEA